MLSPGKSLPKCILGFCLQKEDVMGNGTRSFLIWIRRIQIKAVIKYLRSYVCGLVLPLILHLLAFSWQPELEPLVNSSKRVKAPLPPGGRYIIILVSCKSFNRYQGPLRGRKFSGKSPQCMGNRKLRHQNFKNCIFTTIHNL